MNKIPITAITSIIPSVMLCIGIGIVMVPPIVFEVVSSYSPDSDIVKQATESPLMASTLPRSYFVILILGLAVLGVHGLLKNKEQNKRGLRLQSYHRLLLSRTEGDTGFNIHIEHMMLSYDSRRIVLAFFDLRHLLNIVRTAVSGNFVALDMDLHIPLCN